MSFTNLDIRSLRQRLGWSVAEMARRMGCNSELIQNWENGTIQPDSEALNQLRFLRTQAENYNTRISEKPIVEQEMEERRMAQLTHRDFLKDS